MNKTTVAPLIDIMKKLRDPEKGCPWDLKQTYATIVPYTLEEAYEVADAIEQADFEELKGELGDLLFQVIFYCQLAVEDGLFDFSDVVDTVCEKLTRRHPHVFGEQSFTEEQVKANWEAEKQKERMVKNDNEFTSILSNIPKSQPALTRANKIQKRCASVGFDWPDVQGALDKVDEEVAELKAELHASTIDTDKVTDEMGDLMFAMVNLSRKLKLDPEATLRQASAKFTRRFNAIEQLAHQENTHLENLELSEMEALWREVKKAEKIN
ncbi:nucleoside triphosphate pyrophosphohydrolase [Algibacillus agarilyticus]|uniref:nucleoside triphosphate pyrophosphohydrolase n=1 Tax=Algibacillus agarilyticus TaxID=2234133 RepID=UPI000DCFCB11|nr:nucleoside triphosphate pyrophosphohydrolase [Algibacillus agarilyticus]